MSDSKKLVLDIIFSALLYLVIAGFVSHFYKDLAQWQIIASHSIVFGLGLFMKTRGEQLVRIQLDKFQKDIDNDRGSDTNRNSP